jgi:hypothetical protein
LKYLKNFFEFPILKCLTFSYQENIGARTSADKTYFELRKFLRSSLE